MKSYFSEAARKIVSFTSSGNKSEKIATSDSKINKVSPVNFLPKRAHDLLDTIYQQATNNGNANNNNDEKNTEIKSSNKANTDLLVDLPKFNKGLSDVSIQSIFSKILNLATEKGFKNYKCCSCSSCCCMSNRTAGIRNRKSRGNGKHRIRSIDHIQSATYSTIPNRKIHIEITVPSPKHFQKVCENYTKPRKKLKVTKVYDFQQKKSRLIFIKALRVFNNKLTRVTTLNDNKLRNSAALISFTNNGLNNNANLLQRHPFPRSTFYTMNLQVQYDKKNKLKLEPYECEPGVCVPGQCNPVECEKRIKKRLMKKTSTMTSTEIKSQSMSSETDRVHPVSRSQSHVVKQRVPKQKPLHERRGLQYQTLPRKNKNAVRIGSTFSFNVEFSKDRSGSAHTIHRKSSPRRKKAPVSSSGTSWNKKQFKSHGVHGHGIRRRDGKSQSSTTAAYHKGSMIKPKHKRCFCTLELHRKELQHKGINIQMKEVPTENFVTLTTVGQNTKKMRTRGGRRLEPNECEPNVCIPGECDPYECLERIKRRNRGSKDFGTGMGPKNASESSMTLHGRNKAKHDQNKQKRPVKKRHKVIPKQTSIIHVPVKSNHSSRQAVRIGSSFNFNVEFFKDKHVTNQHQISSKPSNKRNQPRARTGQTNTNQQRARSTEKSIQDLRTKRDQDGQVQSPKRHKATKTTGFLERCFCTAKLFSSHARNAKPVKPETRNRRRSSFVDWMSQKVFNSRPRAHAKSPVKTAKVTNTASSTDKIRNKQPQNRIKPTLEPYECEPGVCIPGQCDPYECEKRIKRRLNRDSGTSTQRKKMRSSKTEAKKAKKSRDQDSQPRIAKIRDFSGSKISKTSSIEREQQPTTVSITNHDKQVVRIGSNFSFNIEFYKDRSLNPDNETHKLITSRTSDRQVQSLGKHKQRSSKSISSGPSGYAHGQSQFDRPRTDSKASGDMHLTKRCFCTLQLQNIGTQQQKGKIRLKPENTLIDTSTTANMKYHNTHKEAGTKARKKHRHLKPYECEPGTCVPGQCNPEECYERIKRRNSKAFGTGTENSVMRTDSSITDGRSQMTKIQTSLYSTGKTKMQQSHPQRIVEEPRFPVVHPSYWQGVKIGSNVSFNIEFFKELTAPGTTSSVMDNNIKARHLRLHDQNVGAVNNTKTGRKKHTNTRTKYTDSEMQAKQLTESKASAAGKALKRCFCTAKLHQTKNTGKHPITVGRVEAIHTTPFKPKYHCVKTCTDACSTFINCKCLRNNVGNLKRVHDSTEKKAEMETILPYAPRKYTNLRSKTLLTKVKHDNFCKYDKDTKKCNYGIFQKIVYYQGKNEETELNQKIKKCHQNCLKKSKSEREAQKSSCKPKSTKSQKFGQVKTQTHNRSNKNNCIDQPLDKKVKFNLTGYGEKKTQLYQCGDACLKQNTQSRSLFLPCLFKSKECLKNLCKKNTDFTEIKIKGKRLNRDICIPKNSKNSTKVTISGSCMGCEIFKRTGRKSIKYCTATCAPCLETKQRESCSCNKCICPKASSTYKTPRSNIQTNKIQTSNENKISKPGVKLSKNAKLNDNAKTSQIKNPKSEKKDKMNKNKRSKAAKKEKPCICKNSIGIRNTCKRRAKNSNKKLRAKGSIKVQICSKIQQMLRNERKRRKLYEKEDKIRLKRRRANNRQLLWKTKRSKDYNDLVQVSGSLVDVGKLGLTATSDAGRSTFRNIRNPLTAILALKRFIFNPSKISGKVKKTARNTGAVSTCKRIKIRLKSTWVYKTLKYKLESHPITCNIVHICDKNTKRRDICKKKKIKKRIPDFECSLFLTSLRKRPCLAMYQMFPWCYPQLLSLLQAWKQFTELFLFLLAVIVWSPCLLTIELVRAFICCCLCTA